MKRIPCDHCGTRPSRVARRDHEGSRTGGRVYCYGLRATCAADALAAAAPEDVTVCTRGHRRWATLFVPEGHIYTAKDWPDGCEQCWNWEFQKRRQEYLDQQERELEQQEREREAVRAMRIAAAAESSRCKGCQGPAPAPPLKANGWPSGVAWCVPCLVVVRRVEERRARVCDLIRRTGVEDSEILAADVERLFRIASRLTPRTRNIGGVRVDVLRAQLQTGDTTSEDTVHEHFCHTGKREEAA